MTKICILNTINKTLANYAKNHTHQRQGHSPVTSVLSRVEAGRSRGLLEGSLARASEKIKTQSIKHSMGTREMAQWLGATPVAGGRGIKDILAKQEKEQQFL